MNGYEMEGFLRGKCLPGDMKVNESNAQYLVRKFSEFESNLSESQREFRAADATIHNLELKLTDMAVQLANAESKCRELAGLVAENADLKSLIEQHAGSIAVCPNCSHEEPSETDDIVALYRSLKTPATDSFLAEVRAQGVEMMAAEADQLMNEFGDDSYKVMVTADLQRFANAFAAQLRKGAAL
ncbi:hypothetical protein [Citrobacter sp. Cpo150]|uniref:hypothetical protein n=1 Tax=Citrobacter sp. Cpo150 TaxID=2985154 RepID=UPI002576FFFD|nr:hypothetical protein [Citrobacter sp. Cpo150]MDM2764401.1 hypothetical protein [Citrobacter sp. Cpo150]